MPAWIKYALMALVLLLLLGAYPLAMQFETGSIQGVITNDFGPVAKASVEAHSVLTGAIMSGASARTASDAAGIYRLDNLRVGRYSLWVEAAGHEATWVPVVSVERGKTTRQDVHLTRIPTIPTGL